MMQYFSNDGKKNLSAAVTTWFITAVAGQLIFAAYVFLFYGKATITGHAEDWNKVLPHGYVGGDLVGNMMVGLHLLLTLIITIAGPLQLIPGIRKLCPVFHRWSGRVYISVAIIISLTGLFMVWVRGSVGGMTQHISISINAVLILVTALLTVMYARRRNFKRHRTWAIRLFLLVNGVWFFRVGFHCWLFFMGPVGFDPATFQGPILTLLSISQYTLPLLVFEMYLRAGKRANRLFVVSVAGIIFLFTIIMAIGIFAATMNSWWPLMK